VARWKRHARPSTPPEPAGPLLDQLFSSLKLDEPARTFRALRAFQRAAGPHIGARARAERLRGAILYVRVTSSAWSQELHVLKSQLIAKLHRTPGGEPVQDLRFSVGPIDDLPDWNALDAQPRAQAPAQSPTPRGVPSGLAEAVANVRDPELRDELSRLLLARP
jgi:hypothetical protein